jgi:hypothetical protein
VGKVGVLQKCLSVTAKDEGANAIAFAMAISSGINAMVNVLISI